MKKVLLILLSLLMLVCVFAGCGGTIEINVNFVVDGEVYDTITTTGNETIKMPENPTKAGYVFDGWYWDNDTFQKPFTANSLLNQELSGDMSVYAKWISEELVDSTYTVTFNSMGGSEVFSQSVKYSSLVAEPEDPTKDGYIFVGWYKLADYSEKWLFDTDTVTKDITLYAKWTEDNTEHVHSYKAVVTNPTCLLQGYTTHTCACGDSYIDTYTEPTGHTSQNGVCISCGTRTESMGLLYTLNSDNNSYTLTDVGTCTDTDLVIPSAYKGLPVTAIGEGAFLYCDLITSVIIPDSVTSIGSGAFDDCINIEEATLPAVAIPSIPKNSLERVAITSGESIEASAFSGCTTLTSVTIADSVTSIGNNAFNGCTSIEEATIPSLAITYIPKNSLKNVAITSGASIPENAFKDCTTLESIVIPNSVKGIEASAFYGCTSLESATLSNATRNIGANAFYNCTSLASVIIPASVRSMGDNVFYNCASLTSITVEEENISYKSIDGVLYTKDVTTLIQYPALKEDRKLNVPNSVTTIKENAFSGCTSIKEAVLPTFVVVYIPKADLEKVVITTGATEIADGSFSESTKLTSITVNEDNTLYKSIDDVLYSKDGTKIICYPAGKTDTSFELPSDVVSIASGSFNNCSSLKTLVIGRQITQIPDSLLSGCSSLENLTIPFVGTSASATDASASTLFGSIFGGNEYTGATATKQYYGTDTSWEYRTTYIPNSLKNITVTGGIILYGAFSNCFTRSSITFPNTIYYIGPNAFQGCYFQRVNYLGDIEDWCNSSYDSNPLHNVADLYLNGERVTELVIPSTVTAIKTNFWGCKSLTSVTIPNSITSIDDYTFYNCDNLTSVTIPNSVTSIGEYAFSASGSLTSITIPDSVTSIDGYAFRHCTSLTSITIPNSVTSIGACAFEGCTSLTSITIPFVGATKDGTSNTHFGYIFGASSHRNNDVYVPSSLKEVIITGGSTIGSFAFAGCTNLTSVTILNSVTSIGSFAFEDCTNLTSVTIPDSVTTIGNCAFTNCTSLTSITIPDSVTRIVVSAFYGCTSLTIYCEATSKPSGWDSGWNDSNRPVVWGYTEK
ncbi:MAG: leucine-rich repeat protein [Clostridia bacterium]|nr:leucine-rich repeat protein [Clostridia bacterium]